MAIRLRLQEIAKARGQNAGTLARKTGLNITSVRRYLKSTTTGTSKGDPLKSIDFDVLEKLAVELEVDDIGQLFEWVRE
jgi:hypothetical protein